MSPIRRDPRYIARKAEEYLRKSGIADTAYFGPEAEFFVFDDVRYRSTQNEQFAVVDSDEAHWNSGRNGGTPNLGHRIRPKEGYFPVAPTDTLQDLRTEMVLTMETAGIPVEAQHHEVAAGGQCEIDMRFDSLRAHGRQGDALQVHRQECGAAPRQDRHLHAQADLRRQWLRHARPHEPLEGRAPALRRRGRLCRPLARWRAIFIGGLLTHAPAHAGAGRADHQQLPAPGARL